MKNKTILALSMSFAGSRITDYDDQELVKLARQPNNPWLWLLSVSITETVVLSSRDTALLLVYVNRTCWRADFEHNLRASADWQPSIDHDGGLENSDSIRGWMPLDVFTSFVSSANERDPVRDVLSRLERLAACWKEAGVDEVWFDFYYIKEGNGE